MGSDADPGGEQRTTNHAVVRNWIENHDGYPAHLARSEGQGDQGLLRVGFADADTEELRELSWEEFFEEFDEKDLVFVYHDDVPDDRAADYARLVERENLDSDAD